jgi:hypothetical protein
VSTASGLNSRGFRFAGFRFVAVMDVRVVFVVLVFDMTDLRTGLATGLSLHVKARRLESFSKNHPQPGFSW